MVSRFADLRLACTIASIRAVVAALAMIGADAQWLAALGHTIAQRGSIPTGVPFAAASSAHWHNVPVLAELIFNTLERAAGDRGLLIAGLVAAATALLMIARDARAGGATSTGVDRMLVIVAIGGLSSLVIVRVQLFSLALFPVLCALLRAQARKPSRRIWLVVPLLALWSNLHGAALLGLGVTVGYLTLVRWREDPRTAVGVALASLAATCLTPALLATPAYYHGLMTNVAAQSGQGMWGPPSLTSPLDLAMLGAAGLLAFWAARSRAPRWEQLIAVVLAGLTIQAARNGIWLILFVAPAAARSPRKQGRRRTSLARVGLVAATAVIAFAIVRGPVQRGANPAILTRALTLAHGTPILASDGIEEQVALAGGRIWIGDPIDAFSTAEQRDYMNFVEGSPAGRPELRAAIEVVLVPGGSPAQRLMTRTRAFVLTASMGRTYLYVRRPA